MDEHGRSGERGDDRDSGFLPEQLGNGRVAVADPGGGRTCRGGDETVLLGGATFLLALGEILRESSCGRRR